MSDNNDELLRQLAAERRRNLDARPTDRQRPTSRPLTPRAADAPVPLSAAQLPIWLHQTVSPHSVAFNCPLSVRIGGRLDSAVLADALRELTARHEVLRAGIRVDRGVPQLAVRDGCAIDFAVEHLDTIAATERESALTRRVSREHNRPFVLATAPLLRARLFVLDREDFFLALTVHHVISDARSMRLILEELVAIYEARSQAARADLPENEVDYGDYCVWTRTNAADSAAQISALCRRYADFQALALPFPARRTHAEALSGRKRFFTLDARCRRDIVRCCGAHGITPFVFHAAVLLTLLGRYTGQRSICIAAPSAVRPLRETENVVGCFLNTLLIKAELDETLRFAESLRQVRAQVAQALEQASLPFESVAAALRERLGIPAEALLGALFSFNDVEDAQYTTGTGLTITPYAEPTFEPRSEFAVTVTHNPDGIAVSVEYDSDRFPADFSTEFGDAYCRWAQALAADPQLAPAGLEVLATERRERQLAAGRGSNPDWAPDPVMTQFARQVAQHADDVALFDSTRSVTFAQLDERSATLAAELAHGVRPGDLVALYLQRSIEFAAALLAVVRIGATFLPLDPAEPAARARAALEAAGVGTAIADDAETLERLREWGLRAIHAGQMPAPRTAAADFEAPADMPLYCIHTSGSTGRRNAVLGVQRGILNRLRWMRDAYPSADDEVCCFKTSVGFVDSVCELLAGLLGGVPTRVVSKEELLDVAAFVAGLERDGITRLVVVPSLLARIVDHLRERRRPLAGLRVCVSSGEALPVGLQREFFQHIAGCRLLNLYGSAEVSADATCAELGPDDAGATVGRPLPGVTAYVLDDRMRLLPDGCVGELYVGGAAPGAGYLNAPALTAARFVPDPFSAGGGRLFRTGDLAHWTPDHTLAIVGRRDHMLKIRGQRVEPGEIEASVQQLPEVEAAIVAPCSTEADEPELALFVRPRMSAATDARAGQRSMDFGVFFFGDHDAATDSDYALFRRSAVAADALGLAAVWVPERHFHSVAGLYSNPAILAGWAASATERIDIRAGSVVLPLNNPIRVAEAWAMVDQLSGGRAGVSFASGWVPRDFALAPEHYPRRREVLQQGVRQIEKLWRGEEIPARDGAGTDTMIRTFPQPAQRRLPIWITCSGDPALFAYAGRHGYNILTALLQQSVAELAAKLRLYRQSLREHGHSVEDKTVTLMLHTLVGEDGSAMLEKARPALRDYLRSHIDLARNLLDSDVVSIDAELEGRAEDVVDFAVERYTRQAALIGDFDTCARMVERVGGIGVTEIACLVDFGVDQDTAVAGLDDIARLMRRCRDRQAPDIKSVIRTHLTERLPAYMIPTRIAFVDEFPLLPSGKIDRQGLVTDNPLSPLISRPYSPPESETESELAEIWQQLLHADRIGREDSFFELGGHSLSAVQMVNRIETEFLVKFAIKWIFDHPTLAAMASRIDTQVHKALALIDSIQADESD